MNASANSKEKKVRKSIAISEKLWKKAEKLAGKQKRSISSCICFMLEKSLKNQNPENI